MSKENDSCFKVINSILWECTTGEETIVIPDDVKKIGPGVFADSTQVKHLVLPQNYEGCSAPMEVPFSDCINLQSIEVDKKNKMYTSIDGVLYSKDLKTLVCWPQAKKDGEILEGTVCIGRAAFEGSQKKHISIPKSVSDIGWSAFTGSSLENIEIPEGINELKYGLFKGCKSLHSIVLPKTLREISMHVFSNCVLETIDIPEGVTSISTNAFLFSSVRRIVMPTTLETIGVEAFNFCNNLEEIVLKGNSLVVEKRAFSDCPNLKKITINESIKKIDRWAFAGCSAIESIDVNVSKLTLGDNCFDDELMESLIKNASLPLAICPTKQRESAAACFAKKYMDGLATNDKINLEWLGYIKKQRKKLLPIAVENESLLQLMLKEKMIKESEVPQ